MEEHMSITGGKVILRAAKGPDLGMLLNLSRDPEIVKVTKGYQSLSAGMHPAYRSCFLPVPSDGLRRIIAAREKPEEGLGIIMLSDIDTGNKTAQIQIKILRMFRGRGYGRDAVETLVSWAFRELHLNCICSHILEDNTASRRLFEVCGFRQEGLHEGRTDAEGHCRKVCVYVRREVTSSCKML